MCKYVKICVRMFMQIRSLPCASFAPCILVVGCRRFCCIGEYSLCGKGDYHADDYAKTVWSSLHLH